MALLEKEFVIKRSTLPDAGSGLFTKVPIAKGTRILEYKGRISNWKDLEEKEWSNGYLFYVNRNHVINALPYKKSLARYANDAKGLKKIKGLRNNSVYNTVGKKVFIEACTDIAAGEEILVDYGTDYWKAVRHNLALR
ncbi:MAG: SET domain-containing protein [Bacteroidota bacterium]